MKNELLMAYSVLNGDYLSGLVKQIRGAPAGTKGDILSLGNPEETYVPLGTTESDPKLFSYAYGQDPAVLTARVTTTPGTQPSSCEYTLSAPDADRERAWQVLARDIVLQDSAGTNLATNPYGLAQAGTMLYLIDYDSQMICPLGANELNGLPPGAHALALPPLDLGPGTTANLPRDAKGQAIIALKDTATNTQYLYALYNDVVLTPFPSQYNPSILVRLRVVPVSHNDPSGLAYVDQVNLGLNAQEIIPLIGFNGAANLLIPCIGGPQQSGITNETDSRIDLVTPFGPALNPTVLVTGDPRGTPGSYDFRAVAAPSRPDDAGLVYILNATYDANYNLDWTIYRGIAASIIGMPGQTLSWAIGNGILSPVDSGTGSPGSYWDIYIETGAAPEGDRFWYLKGSPIAVTSTTAYGLNQKYFGAGYDDGDIGGINVDSAVLIAETMRQAALGISLKRGLRGAPAPAAEEEEK